MSDNGSYNRTVGLGDLVTVDIAGRMCRVDVDVSGDTVQVTVYDAETGLMIATLSDTLDADAQLLALAVDVLANGW